MERGGGNVGWWVGWVSVVLLLVRRGGGVVIGSRERAAMKDEQQPTCAHGNGDQWEGLHNDHLYSCVIINVRDEARRFRFGYEIERQHRRRCEDSFHRGGQPQTII